MKRSLLFAIAALFAVACTGPAGMMGPQGPAGATGAQGLAGVANAPSAAVAGTSWAPLRDFTFDYDRADAHRAMAESKSSSVTTSGL
jgi:hypothetical protein